MSATDTISFNRVAFDDFMVAIAQKGLLVPTLGNALNNLLENEVEFQPVAWMKDLELGLGLPERGEEALYRRKVKE